MKNIFIIYLNSHIKYKNLWKGHLTFYYKPVFVSNCFVCYKTFLLKSLVYGSFDDLFICNSLADLKQCKIVSFFTTVRSRKQILIN